MTTTPPPTPAEEAARLRQAIAALEEQRALLGDAVVEAALGSMRQRLATLETAVPPGRRRKQSTVLFGDIVGFTALSETRDAEVVAQVINTLWARVDAAILAHGGRIDKHIGDAVMAVWGAEVAREDDPEQAVRAALAMQVTADECCRLLGLPLALRVGVHTGPVLAGPVGAAGETTVMGETVNLAARIESAAPPGGVLVSHATYRHIRGVFDVQPWQPLMARGVSQPITVYIVERAKPRAFRVGARGIEGIETRMVGRDTELRALQDAFSATLAERRPRFVTIAGEAGVGKSRLLYEFDNWLELRPEEVVYYEGRAVANPTAFGLFRDLFAHRFDILDSDPPPVALDKFRGGFASVLGGNKAGAADQDEDADAAGIVGHWLGFDFDASPAVARLLGSPEFGLTAQAHLLRYFRAQAAADPLVIYLDDIHWADDASLDLARDLADALRGSPAPVFFVAPARPTLFERRPDWAADRPGFTRVDLRPLSAAGTLALVDEVLQRVDDLPPRLRRRIADASGGNPFFVEELVKMLIEQGVIERGGEGEQGSRGEKLTPAPPLPLSPAPEEVWHVRAEKLAGLIVPTTLVGLLQARLDALPPVERLVLQCSAVIGRVFWDVAVDDMVDDAAIQAIQAAVARELIYRRERSAFAGAGEFTFKHALLREVCYETVLLADRRALHGRVARWLEAHAGDRLDEYLTVLAEHWVAAGDSERAGDYMARSGELALAAGNHVAACVALRRSGQLTAPAATDLVRLGESCFMVSDLPGAADALARALDLARAANDRTAEVDSLYWRSRVATAQGDFVAADAFLQTALPLARAIGGAPLARALEGLAGVAGSRGELAAAGALAAEALALAHTAGDVTLEMRCLGLLGTFARLDGDLDAAGERFEAARALAHRAGNLEREATALLNLGDLAYRRGRFADARDAARVAFDLFRDQGRPDAIATAGGNLAQAELMCGDRRAAAGEARRALSAARDAGAAPLILFTLSVYAQVIADEDAPLARALLALVRDHPATEYQDREEAIEKLAHMKPAPPAAPLELDAAVAAVLGE